MIHSLLEMEFNQAINSTENKNEDGSINWNFVDSDCYMSGVPKLYKDDTEYYADWNNLADKFEAKSSTVDFDQTSLNFNQEEK